MDIVIWKLFWGRDVKKSFRHMEGKSYPAQSPDIIARIPSYRTRHHSLQPPFPISLYTFDAWNWACCWEAASSSKRTTLLKNETKKKINKTTQITKSNHRRSPLYGTAWSDVGSKHGVPSRDIKKIITLRGRPCAVLREFGVLGYACGRASGVMRPR